MMPIDAAYCINLPHRTDRRAAVEKEFAAAAIHVEFFSAIDGRRLAHPQRIKSGQAGCTASHLGVMHDAWNKGCKTVLIFEDDVLLAHNFQAQLALALQEVPEIYDLIYVGAICHKSWDNFLRPHSAHLARAGKVFGTHAYIVNLDRFGRHRLALEPLTAVIDEYFAQTMQPEGNCYVCTPYLAIQAPGHSDVVGGASSHGALHGYYDYIYR